MGRKRTRQIIMGVYKITSPSGRIYVGSSKDIYRRWIVYKSETTKGQKVLYKSFQKYGIDNHVFEIIEIVNDSSLLFERERFHGDRLKCLVEFGGLNLCLPKYGDKPRIYSDKTIKRFSEIGKNRKYSNETIEKFRARMRGNKNWLGKNHSTSTKEKISARLTGRPTGRGKIILNTEYGIFYNSTKEAAMSVGLTRGGLEFRMQKGYQKLKVA